mgnify:CR=1 FL=1
MKNKILTITLLAMLILTFLCTSCFASNENTITIKDYKTGKDLNIIMPSFYKTDGFNYVLIQNLSIDSNNDYSSYCINICNKPFYVQTVNGKKYISVPSDSIYYWKNVYTTGDFYSNNTIDCSSMSFTLDDHNSFDRISYYRTDNVYYSVNYTNYDILDDEGDLVFQGPQVEGVVAPLVKSIDFSETLKEILEIFPLVLMVLIGLLSLRKAIALMFQTFRAS